MWPRFRAALLVCCVVRPAAARATGNLSEAFPCLHDTGGCSCTVITSHVASGPIPRDGFVTDAYQDLTRAKLHELGFSDVLGETGERPDELMNGIDHLDKLEHLGPSAKDKRFSEGFTGNERLYTAKLAVGGKLDEYYDRQGSTGSHHTGDISGGNATRQWNKGVNDHHGGLADSEWDQFAKGQ